MIVFGTRRAGGRTVPSILMRRRFDRYTSTLTGLVLPAVIAAMAASVMMADAKPRSGPTLSLYERTEQLRYAATKVPTEPARVSHSAAGVRVISIHEPVADVSTDDLGLASNEVLADGS